MMKKNVYLFIMLLAHAPAFANTQFRWAISSNNTLKDENGQNIGSGNATILTFTSNNTSVDALVSGTQLILQNTYVPDDSFYKALANSTTGYYNSAYMEEQNNNLVGKYVYAIILNMPFATYQSLGGLNNVPRDGTIMAGITSMGTISSVITPIAEAPPYPAQSFTGGPIITNLQIIPEPSSVGLLCGAAGVLAAAVGRRIRRR